MARHKGEHSTYLSNKVSRETFGPYVTLVDTETLPIPDSDLQRFVLGVRDTWKVDDDGLPLERVEQAAFYDVNDLHKALKRYPGEAIAHNWEFDAYTLGFANEDIQRRHGFTLNVGKSILPVERKGYQPFLMHLDYSQRRSLRLICNTNFWKTKLADLGESFGMPKMTMPGRDTYADEAAYLEALETYCRRDVEILRMAWFSLFEFSYNIAGTTPGFTAAMMCMRMYQSGFLPDTVIDGEIKVQGTRHLPDVSAAEQAAYKGGRTDTFWKGKAPAGTEVFKYDVNSMYPSVMKGDMPVRFERRVDNKYGWQAAEGNPGRFIYLCHVTLEIDPDTPLGWLGLEGIKLEDEDGQSKLVFPAGRFKVWLWQPQLEIAYREGWLAEIHETLSYNRGQIFDDYVDTLYARKREAKLAGEKAKEALYKLSMNGLYGKFGQKDFNGWTEASGDEYRMLYENDRPSGEIWAHLAEDGSEPKFMQMSGRLWKYQETATMPKRHANMAIAGYITAKGRAVLFEAMKAVIESGGTLFMCDTDGIISDTHLPAHLIDEYRLGAWKLEGTAIAENTDFQCPKHYSFDTEVHIKGVPVGAKQNADGSYTVQQFAKLRTDVMSQNAERRERAQGEVRITPRNKHISGVNTKRREQGDGMPTNPIVVDLTPDGEVVILR